MLPAAWAKSQPGSAYVVQGFGDSGNGVHLSGQEVHPSDHAQCQRVPGVRNGCFEHLCCGFFGSRVDNNQVLIRIKVADANVT